jgi:hypothetical protein
MTWHIAPGQKEKAERKTRRTNTGQDPATVVSYVMVIGTQLQTKLYISPLSLVAIQFAICICNV